MYDLREFTLSSNGSISTSHYDYDAWGIIDDEYIDTLNNDEPDPVCDEEAGVLDDE